MHSTKSAPFQPQPNSTQHAEKNLFDCIRDEDLDALRRYVERGGPVHVADTLGDTSLLVAASTGNPEVVKVGSLVWFRLVGLVGWLIGFFYVRKVRDAVVGW